MRDERELDVFEQQQEFALNTSVLICGSLLAVVLFVGLGVGLGSSTLGRSDVSPPPPL